MIYPNYFNWPGKVWICSDLHLGDKGILSYERTEFQTPEEHIEFVIKAINSQLNETDTFVCLGDLGKYWEASITKIKKCAKKILIMGNHDRENKGKYKHYFDEVYDGPLFVNRFTVLSHEPIPISEHFINIHGHLHTSYLDDDHHINVSFAMADYKLFPLDETIIKSEKYPRIRAKFLEEWYADKYVFTKLRKDVLIYKDTMHIVPIDLKERSINKALKLMSYEEDREKFIEFFGRKLVDFRDVDVFSKDNEDTIAIKLIKFWRENGSGIQQG